MSAQGMPPQILALFAPRLPLEYYPPIGATGQKPAYTGIADLIKQFETVAPPPVPPFESPKERKSRKKKEKLQDHRKQQEDFAAAYDPHKADCATKNPYATLFVGRLSYDTTEKKLKKEFECFGSIRRVKVITDFNGKSRGYAFVEYESEADLKTAYKQGDGKKIDGRRVLVDVERSRTVPGWTPRRLGGGKGSSRLAEPKKKGAAALPARGMLPGGPSYPSSRPSWQGPGGGGGYRGGRGGGYGGPRRGDDSRGAYGGGRPGGGYRGGDMGGGGRYGRPPPSAYGHGPPGPSWGGGDNAGDRDYRRR